MLKQGDKIALVVNSNGISLDKENELQTLLKELTEMGLTPVCSQFLYQKKGIASGSPKERGMEMNAFFADRSVQVIFDISGGDIANQVLPYLDYELIKKHPKPFFGYSDVTTILNGIYQQTGVLTYLFQLRTILWDQTGRQKKRFVESFLKDEESLFDCQWQFIQGETISGELIGGNIRCFLKLAGTPYFPDCRNKVLLLESNGGGIPQLTTYLTQLKQIGVFNQISGILLGVFTELEASEDRLSVGELVREMIDNPDLSVAKTSEIGHGSQSCCAVIGQQVSIKKNEKTID
ncbi:LD-carboxypeptidase [uncultured Vagococcus sp.]|uniref:S66 family peptidase n=1 Tax=uncultured Vagococcus sp. TaxID=189676 RepID=UPI0028D7D58A|nr:LD-carboxypeptidase [uncultured Vagococcus sp.]